MNGEDTTDPISAMLKLRSGLAYLQNSNPIKLDFAPDALRDTSIMIDNVDQFIDDALKENSKNRIGMDANIKIGGHGAIGIISAATLRQDTNVECALIAKVLAGARQEVLDSFINQSITAKGATPINADFVLDDHGAAGKTNIVLEIKKPTPTGTAQHTTIGTVRGQPVLRLSDFKGRTAELLNEMSEADVVGILSLKSPAMKEIPPAMRGANLKFKELVSDVTTGDDTQVVVDAINFLKKEDCPITLLSLNDEEAVRYAPIAWALKETPAKVEKFLKSERYCDAKLQLAEAQKELLKLDAAGALPSTKVKWNELMRECEAAIKNCSDDFERKLTPSLSKQWNANPLEAAEFLNGYLGIPLLFHNFAGSKIFDKTGGRETAFVPSISLVPASGTLGAGDTMLGAIMLAMAVKARLEKENAPAHLRMSLEDCLMVANIATGFRLQNEKVAGTANDCYDWVSQSNTSLTALKSAGQKGHWQAKVADDVGLVGERLKSLQAAKKSNFAPPEYKEAQGLAGEFVVKRFHVEEIKSGFIGPEDAASKAVISKLLGYAGGKDIVFSSAAIDSLRILAKASPSVKQMVRRDLGLGKEQLVVMFDLDSTLFDSKSARERAGALAIQSLGLKVKDARPSSAKEELLDFGTSKQLFVSVYDAYAKFKDMGFPDFRQVWNTKQMYAAAIALLETGDANGRVPKNLQELNAILRKLNAQDSPLSDFVYCERLARRMNRLLNDPSCDERLAKAVETFSKVGLTPYSDARRTLSILTEVLDAKLYVVTEGHDATQLKKVKMLGLNEFFGGGDRILSTEFVGAPWRDSSDIADVKAKLEKELNVIAKQLADSGPSPGASKSIESWFLEFKAKIGRCSEEMLVLEWAEKIQTGNTMRSKDGSGSFYPEIFHAISQRPDKPREVIGVAGNGGSGWSSDKSYIAVMVGDRFDQDILPLRSESPEVITCLLKKGKYKQEYEETKAIFLELKGARLGDSGAKEYEQLVSKAKELAARLGSEWLELGVGNQDLAKLFGLTTKEEAERHNFNYIAEESGRLFPQLETESLSDVLHGMFDRATFAKAHTVVPPDRFIAALDDNWMDMLLLGKISQCKTLRQMSEDLTKESAKIGNPANLANFLLEHLDERHLEQMHGNRGIADVKTAAIRLIGTLLESVDGQDMNDHDIVGPPYHPSNHEKDEIKAVIRKSADALAMIFSDDAEPPGVRKEAILAYGRFCDDKAPLSKMEDGPLEDEAKRVEQQISARSRLKYGVLWKTLNDQVLILDNEKDGMKGADWKEKLRICTGLLNKQTRLMREDPHVARIRKDLSFNIRLTNRFKPTA